MVGQNLRRNCLRRCEVGRVGSDAIALSTEALEVPQSLQVAPTSGKFVPQRVQNGILFPPLPSEAYASNAKISK